jgi:hypothetical protein
LSTEPHCFAPGIRKFAATHAAEAGATEHQLMGMFTWDDPKQAATYTKQTRQQRLARVSMHLLSSKQWNKKLDWSSRLRTALLNHDEEQLHAPCSPAAPHTSSYWRRSSFCWRRYSEILSLRPGLAAVSTSDAMSSTRVSVALILRRSAIARTPK